MSVAIAIDVIGIIAGVLMSVPMLKSMVPKHEERTTTVRIGLGTSTSSDASTSGNAPDIHVFDVVGRSIAKAHGHSKISDGGYQDYKAVASASTGGRQAQYLSVSKAGNDAVCIAYISMTWPGGNDASVDEDLAWYGDVGYQCGAFWYASQTVVGDDDYTPKCVWIDGDDTNGINIRGLGIHMTDFTATDARAKAYQNRPDTMCNSPPRFHMYKNLTIDNYLPYFDPVLEYNDDGVDADISRVLVPGAIPRKSPPQFNRRARSRRWNNSTAGNGTIFLEGHLITSNRRLTSAVELCKSETSYGADHVSYYEGFFCDMTAKELWALCDDSKGPKTACFDTRAKAMRPGTGIQGRDEFSGRPVPIKEYHTVTEW